jgi:PAS domain S-box-containing protein
LTIDPNTEAKHAPKLTKKQHFCTRINSGLRWLGPLNWFGSLSANNLSSGNARTADRYGKIYLSNTPSSSTQQRLALAVVILSALVFLCVLPLARTPLTKVPAFIVSCQSALFFNGLISSVLLFSQFAKLRSRSLLVLACGYLFETLIVFSHTLTFPGVFSDTGLLSAGSQTTAWLYAFWHSGFPLFILGYALLRDSAPDVDELRGRTSKALTISIFLIFGSVVLLSLLSTWGMGLLPIIIRGHDYSDLMRTVVGPTSWLLNLIALIALCRPRLPTVLDLWLRVAMFARLLEVGASAIINSSRYDLGWYVGRSYGLLAAGFVLVVLLLQTSSLHNRLAAARIRLVKRARDLDDRVMHRTQELVRSNSTLKAEISERMQAEAALHRIRSFLDAIIESLPAVLLVKNAADDKIVLANRAAEHFLGYSRSEIIGKCTLDLLPAVAAQWISRHDQKTLLSGKANDAEYPLETRQRGLRWVRSKKVPVLDEEGTQKYIATFVEDITERRQIEEELRQSQKMEALGQLTGGLAHDFNNLLAVVIGNLDVLGEFGTLNPKQEELVQAALEAALSGGELSRRLLAFARRQPLQPEHVDVNELVAGITKLLSRTLGEDIRVQLDLEHTIKPIVVDRVQLETALTNLANNARDAMPVGGLLTIVTRNRHLDSGYAAQYSEVEPGDYVMIEVNDNGQGMAPETLNRIFEPFFTTKAIGKGTGLGLSMVFGFIRQSRGHINVYSEPGQGTTLRLYFRPAEEKPSNANIETPPLRKQSTRKKMILVVEDNPKLREIVVRQLTSSGFKVLEAENVLEALVVLENERNIDLVFTDVVLPGDIDGYALAQIIEERFPNSKILLTSGFPGFRFNDGELKTRLPLLSKPYRKEDLARMVREVLD